MQAAEQINLEDSPPLLELELPLASFAAEWKHCDRMASYIARMVSVSRPDPQLTANLLSSALNEVFETLFRLQDETPGRLACRVSHPGMGERVELFFPCAPASRAFFRDALTLATRPDIETLYIDALISEGPISPFAGLLELVVDYGARLSLSETDAGLHLILDLHLERA